MGLGPGIGRGAETMKLVRDVVARIAEAARDRRRRALRLRGRAGAPGGAHGADGADAASRRGRPPARAIGARPSTAIASGLRGPWRSAPGRWCCSRAPPASSPAPDGRVVVNPTGGPALGTGRHRRRAHRRRHRPAGPGCRAFEAAALAAFVHGAAADRIAAASGSSGLLAGDLARALPAEFAALRGDGPRRRAPTRRTPSCDFLPRALRDHAPWPRACWRRVDEGGLVVSLVGPARRRQDRLREGPGRRAWASTRPW